MDLAVFNAHCATYAGSEMVVQWGEAQVWKVGGKVFAIASKWGKGVDDFHPVFKVSDLSFQMMLEQEGIVAAPYLGRYKWVQVRDEAVLSDEELFAYIGASYEMVVSKLTRAQRVEAGLHC